MGSLTKIPALQSFCVQAAIAIIFNFFFQIFTFVVFLILDEERKEKRKLDLLCCFKTEGEIKEDRKLWRRLFSGPYYRVLRKDGCIWSVVAFSVLLFGLAIAGCMMIPVGLNEQVSMEVNSNLFDYFTYEKKYIEIGPPAYIVLNNFDYENENQINQILSLSNEISKLEYIQPPVYSWFASFNNFRKSDAMWSDTCGSENIDTLTY